MTFRELKFGKVSQDNTGIIWTLLVCIETERGILFSTSLYEASLMQVYQDDILNGTGTPEVHTIRDLILASDYVVVGAEFYKIEDDTWFSRLVLTTEDSPDETTIEIRPGEAIPVCLAYDAPIMVAEDLFQERSFDLATYNLAIDIVDASKRTGTTSTNSAKSELESVVDKDGFLSGFKKFLK